MRLLLMKFMIWSFGCAKLLPNQHQARLETTPGGGNRNGDFHDYQWNYGV